MWPSLIRKSKEGGLNTIETYVFWNAHEPQPRQVFNLFIFKNIIILLKYNFISNFSFFLFSMISLKILTWLDLSRPFVMKGFMPFLELDHMFVLNGIMGNYYF